MSIDAKRRSAAAAFAALLILSVFWPAPIVDANALCCHAPLAVDALSFLGREAPAYDVIFWCIAGLVAIAIVQSGELTRDALREPWHIARAVRPRVGARVALLLVAIGALIVAAVWRFLDAPVTAFAERIQSDQIEDTIRYANRFGGGMNPAMVVAFFLLAGVAYRHRRWIEYGVAMTFSGAAAGILVQIVKLTVGRTRPELWLGPFHHARASATSFPSGHTVGAFALAGVLFFGSRSTPARVAMFLVAAAVGVSRILAFRHWASDVVASAILGSLAAYVFVTAVTTESPRHP
jgi:membrane-associated phospholipid phosphatase